MKRLALGSVAAALLMLCGSAQGALEGEAAQGASTNATCVLTAHLNFVAPIKLTPSTGMISADSASWSCTGPIGGSSAYSGAKFEVNGTYGDLGAGADTCTTGLEKLTVIAGPFPGGVGLHLTVNRTALVLGANGTGAAGNTGLTLSGTGAFTPDDPTGCLTGAGWASGSIRLVLLVQGGPVPGDSVGGSYTATRPSAVKHHRKHRHHHHKHKHHRRKHKGHKGSKGAG